MADSDVEYEPASVKALLAEMKNLAELMVDLSYTAVLYDSEAIAEEVLSLEAQLDILQMRARMSLLMAARTTEDAEALAPVLGVVGATEKISDAAGDIAKVVRDDVGIPQALRAAIPEAHEVSVRATIDEGSPFAGRTLGEIALEAETGVRAIAVRRVGGDWVTDPGGETSIIGGDAVMLRGPEEAVADVYERASGESYTVPEAVPADTDLERAVDAIVLMKDLSELAVDLAYCSVLYDSEDAAEEVLALEAEVDALHSRLEAWVLRAAAEADDPVSLRGLARIARASESISDAALEISEGVLRGLTTHPVVAEAVEASDEVVVRFTVGQGAPLAGATLGERAVGQETGMTVVAVRRGTDDWVVSPGPETRIEAGDTVVATGPTEGADRLAGLVGDEREVGP